MKQTAGQSRKTHKSRKTTTTDSTRKTRTKTISSPVGGPPSIELTTAPPPPSAPPENALVTMGQAFKMVDEANSAKDDAKKEDAGNTGVPAEDPKKQWWYRPADSKARVLVNKIVVMREAGRDDKDIAKRLKTTEGSVRQYMYLARKNGWLDGDDELVDVEAELAMNVDRKVVRNVSASLDGQMTNWQTHEMTIAAAKGRGIFKTHEKSEGMQGQLPVVAIQIVMPPIGAGDQLPEIGEDQMGGIPAYCEEGEVIDVDTRPALGTGDTPA